MSSGRHRRDLAPDEPAWDDPGGQQQVPGRQAWDEPAWGDPYWNQQAQRAQAWDEAAWQEPAPRTQAWDQRASHELPPRAPAWDQPASHEPPPRAPDWDQPTWEDQAPPTPAWDQPTREDPRWDQPAREDPRWHQQARRTQARNEAAWQDQVPSTQVWDEPPREDPRWHQQGRRTQARDEPAWDDPRWHEQTPGTQARDELAGQPKGRGTRHGRAALRMTIAAALVAVIGIGISVYGLTSKVPVAGATYTPSTVGTRVPQAQPDPAAPALGRSLPVKIQIPAIHVSAPIMEVGRDPDGEVQVPPLEVHNLTGWYKYGPTPGQTGASVILGHVDSNQGLSVFYYLKDLVQGDQISVTLADGITATFVVDGLQKVTKTNFPTSQVYGKVSYPGLRLVTCGGAFDGSTGHYLDNIIVYAHLVHSATT